MEDLEYAGFWIRVAAALIDTLLFLIVMSIPLTLIYGTSYWTDTEGPAIKGTWDALLQYVVPIVATIWFWVKFMGTPGKMILRLKIVDAKTGQAIKTPKAIGRYLGYYVSIIPLMLGIFWVGIDKRKQGFHDKLAGTVVIRDTAKETVSFSEE